jgi:osmotically-inducible protein OsmY|tara:strand:+ start:448 stop:642 length:195 start_codon:yes stop_codon:yes gene_type:complete
MNKYFDDLEYNCIQVAIDHLIDDLADALSDKKNDTWTKKDLKEKLNACKSVKSKLENYKIKDNQ